MSVYTFGLNTSGALSLGDTESYNKPQKVNYFSTINKRVKRIAAGSYNTVFVTDDDELYIAGLNKDPKYNTTLFYGIEENKPTPISTPTPSTSKPTASTTSSSSSSSSTSSTPPKSITPPNSTTPSENSPKIPHMISTRNLLNKEKPLLPTRSETQLSQIQLERTTPPVSPSLVSTNNNSNNSSVSSNDDDMSKSKIFIRHQMELEPPKTIPVRINTGFLESVKSPNNIIKQVALGNYHIVLLTEGGNVWSWGCNFNGQCGYPQQENSSTPRMVELKCVKSIAAGVKHTAAINEWGELYVWGLNEHGELGLGDTNDRRSPTRVNKLKSEMVSIVACSSTTSVCYTESGKMFVWGQCDEKGKNQMLPLQLPIHSYLSAEIDPTNNSGSCGGGGRIKQIACGQWQIAALTQLGEVFWWNVGNKPQPLRGILDNNSVRSIAMGNFHLVCLTDSGEVITLGRNKTGQLGRVADGNDATAPGIVKELSYDEQKGVGLSKEEFVVSVAAGEYHSVVLVENTAKTKNALLLLRMQRNYLRQLNILEKVYYRSLLAIATPNDILNLPTLGSQKEGGSNRDSLTLSPSKDSSSNVMSVPISSSSSSSSPGLIGSGSGTIKARSHSIATIRGLFGIPNSSNYQDLDFNTMVGEDDIKEIFSDIETLVKSTETFLQRLDNRLDNWDAEKKILGDIFLDETILSSYRVYIPFSDNYNTACMMVFNLKKRSEKFANTLKECEKRSRQFGIKLDKEFVKEIDLKSLLLAPLQNIPRIYIMLKELSLSTLPNHKDFEFINAAAGKFQVLLERMNQNFQFVDAVEILNCSSNEYGNPQIMGGSLDQLVDKLTHHNISDPHFREVFLLTFRSFTTPQHLLGLLIDIHNRQISSGKTNRVINVITSWVVHHFYDFESDALTQFQENHQPRELSAMLEKFVGYQLQSEESSLTTSVSKSNLAIGATPISTSSAPMAQIRLQYKAQRDIDPQTRVIVPPPLTASSNTPAATLASMTLMDFSPLEIAHSMTLLDQYYLSKIDKREFLQQRWTKGKAPNIQTSTDHFNRMSHIVITEILKSKNSKQRSAEIAFFISVANCSFELNNLSSVAYIIYGLNSAPICRLKKSWTKLSKDSMQLFEYLDKIVTPIKNYISLRQLMTTIQPPCVPFLGTYLKDLTFIEDGNPSVIGGLINFYKHRKIAEVIFQILQFQQVPYSTNVHFNPIIRDYLLTTQTLDEKQAQKVSVECE
ncbi:regulator of chromosome condensation domain-containing protein [Tieghemostelium lacteum]|uniref:Regulator of chromosome condensation domain-containing protein n=1 Tax=Tieghemostelium lacteum TaxID=361077 RepID=A0A152A0F0_TIELA|nr:regulator of chromosome condensation domain-containing protein [Tieghemostelium lacteum]|eukprot:KYQ99732.1 regulator of chromosome condensation domain-containing protein [Tieghemostelium lacteum]